MIGCIADDFTGATDAANMFAKGGLSVVLVSENNKTSFPDDADVVVVAHKTRSIQSEDAVAQSLETAKKLLSADASQIYFKYCSTFDSTDLGNIGPVTEALMDLLEQDFSVVCPAFPGTGRTVYQGHLFVEDALLADTHMRHHPLNPMTESDVRKLMQAQSKLSVGLIDISAVRSGAEQLQNMVAAQKAVTPHLVVGVGVPPVSWTVMGLETPALQRHSFRI